MRILAFIAALLALVAHPVAAQTVVAPQLDSAELHARLARTMDRPGRPLPADAAALDAMLAGKDWLALTRRLLGTADAQAVLLDMNWEQSRLINGAGFLVAYAYVTDLWRLGSSSPNPGGDQLKQSAGMIFLYAFDLARLDGTKCADQTAPGHRVEQLFGQNRPLIAYIQSLPRAQRMTLGTISLAVETATAPMRADDEVLCTGGMDEMIAGLAANGNRPLPQVPTSPNTGGKAYSVPRAPGYAARFIGAEVWRPKQTAIRQALPAELTELLAAPGDTAAPPAK